MRVFLTALFLIAATLVPLVEAQTPDDPNEGSRLEWDAANSIWRFKWWGRPGRTYFIQHSDDLHTWVWLPLVEPGNNAVREWGFTSTGNKFFLRLMYSDLASSDPENDDFDGDGVSNLAEVMQGTSPLRTADSDSDGLPDDWETTMGLDPQSGSGSDGATGDADQDGLTNEEEAALGTKPKVADTDGDGLSDSEDAVPTNRIMTVRAAPEARYARIDLGVEETVGVASGLNDAGEVLLKKSGSQGYLWKSGTASFIANSQFFAGPLQDGSVYYAGQEVMNTEETDTVKEETWSKELFRWRSNEGSQSAGKQSESKEMTPITYVSQGALEGFLNSPPKVEMLSQVHHDALDAAYFAAKSLVYSYQLEVFVAASWPSTGQGAAVYALNDAHVKIISAWQWGAGDFHHNYQELSGSFAGEINGTIGSASMALSPPRIRGSLGGAEFPDDPIAFDSGGVSDMSVNSENDIVGNVRNLGAAAMAETWQPAGGISDRMIDITEKTTPEGPYFAMYGKIGCFNSGQPEIKNAPGLTPSSSVSSSIQDPATCVGRKLSNSLVCPQWGSIWRNSRVRPIAELCGDSPAGTPAWTNYRVKMVSPQKNLLIGTAAKDNIDHAVLLVPVQIEEVSFGGTKYWELESDDAATTYSAPQWKDVDGNGKPTNATQGEHDYAVAFTRNTKPKIGAKFKIANASNFGTIKIKATGPDGLIIPETTGAVSGDEVTIPLTETSAALVNTIKFYNSKDDAKAFKLDWEVKFGTADWSKIGTTMHTVYITLGDPKNLSTDRQLTLFDTACREATGLTAESDVVNKVYSVFTHTVSGIPTVQRIDPKTFKPSGAAMTYWGTSNPAPQPLCWTTAGLLSLGDGRCGAWATFFHDALSVNGIQSTVITVNPPRSHLINSARG